MLQKIVQRNRYKHRGALHFKVSQLVIHSMIESFHELINLISLVSPGSRQSVSMSPRRSPLFRRRSPVPN